MSSETCLKNLLKTTMIPFSLECVPTLHFLVFLKFPFSSSPLGQVSWTHSASLCPCICLRPLCTLYVYLPPHPYHCSYLLRRPLSQSPISSKGSVIGIQALSQPMQSNVSTMREETSLSGFPR